MQTVMRGLVVLGWVAVVTMWGAGETAQEGKMQVENEGSLGDEARKSVIICEK